MPAGGTQRRFRSRSTTTGLAQSLKPEGKMYKKVDLTPLARHRAATVRERPAGPVTDHCLGAACSRARLCGACGLVTGVALRSPAHSRTGINSHRFPLLVEYVMQGSFLVLPGPQVARTAVPAPAFSRRPVTTGRVQPPRRVGFEVVHYFLRRVARLDHDMHMRSAHMDGQQPPTAVSTHFADSLEHHATAGGVEFIGWLVQAFVFPGFSSHVGWHHVRAVQVVGSVYGPFGAAMQPTPIAGEREKIRPGT